MPSFSLVDRRSDFELVGPVLIKTANSIIFNSSIVYHSSLLFQSKLTGQSNQYSRYCAASQAEEQIKTEASIAHC
jgi:hypothetical protein